MSIIQYIIKKTRKELFITQDISIIKQRVERIRLGAENKLENPWIPYDKTMKDIYYYKEKIGVMYADVLPKWPDRVIIGYSLCNTGFDIWNYVGNGKRYEKNFGIKIARERAEKWSEYEDPPFTSNKYLLLSNQVPDSIRDDLIRFIDRCMSYYKDKELTYWAKDLMGLTVTPAIFLDTDREII